MFSALKKDQTRKSPQDLVALDLGTSGIKAVRIKRLNGVLTLMGADVLPPISVEGSDGSGRDKRKLQLPPALLANYAALAFSGHKAVVRVITLPGHAENPEETEKAIRDHVGLDQSFRVASVASPLPKSKNETRMLALAIPEADAESVLSLVAEGAPAPFSLEVSGVAALNAALMGPVSKHPTDAVIAIECGAQISMLAVFNRGVLVLARKLEVGGQTLIQHIQRQFSVDADMAMSILSQGAIDISGSVKQVIDPFLRQLTISRDFVERQENCRIHAAYISGGMSLTESWTREISRATGMKIQSWNPFEGLSQQPGAFPDRLKGQESRFAAAMGAAFGVLKEAS